VIGLAHALFAAIPRWADAPVPTGPDTVTVQSGTLMLKALLWRPGGRGPFPAVLFNHGSSRTEDSLDSRLPATLGPTFANHGYVFLVLYRRGIGPAVGGGTRGAGDLLLRSGPARTQDAPA
jgi:hypothetical protein